LLGHSKAEKGVIYLGSRPGDIVGVLEAVGCRDHSCPIAGVTSYRLDDRREWCTICITKTIYLD
jgi:hypothetical protein